MRPLPLDSTALEFFDQRARLSKNTNMVLVLAVTRGSSMGKH